MVESSHSSALSTEGLTALAASRSVQSLRGPRRAVMTQFFVCGTAFASWGVQIPLIKTRYGLSDAVMSLTMLALAGGAILAMGRVGHWVTRVGSVRALRQSGLIYAMTTLGIALAPGFISLLLILTLLGMAMGAFDVAMNVQAATLESRSNEPVMSTLHGMFSLGGMFGALSSAVIAGLELPPVWHAAFIAGLTLTATVFASQYLLDENPDVPQLQAGAQLLAKPSIMLGLAAFLGLICEGAMYDWAGIYLRDVADAPLAMISYGYAAFSTGMAVSRFSADFLRRRFSGTNLLSVSAWLGFGGIAAALLLPSPWISLIGFFVMGLGIANLMPLFFLAGTRQPGVPPAQGVAFVARSAYGGMLFGPVLIGVVSHHVELRAALVLVALIMGWIATFGARRIRHLD